MVFTQEVHKNRGATLPYLTTEGIELARVTIKFQNYLTTNVLYDVQSLP